MGSFPKARDLLRARWRPLAALAAGGLVALALPPFGQWYLALGAVTLLALALDGATARQGFAAGWLAGAVATLGASPWMIATVPRFTNLPPALGVALWLLLAAWTGLTWGLAGALAALARSVLGAALAAGLALLAAERFGPAVFPLPLALPLIDAPYLPQSADLVGVGGVGALLLGAAVAACGRGATGRSRSAGLAVVLALAGYGAARTPGVERARGAAPRVRVGLVQPAVGATLRWEEAMGPPILRHLQALTDTVLARSPDVVVWHEGAYPFVIPYRARRDGHKYPAALARADAPPLIFGALARGDGDARYNAAFVRSRDGALAAPVAKRALVAFGEHVPWVGWIPAVRRAFYRAEGLSTGERPEVLRAEGRRYGVLNCFEDTLATSGAEVADADLLVNITNDAWFGGAAGAQHVVAARWRAVETRRDLVRAVNTGRSGLIDALGRAVVTLPDGVAVTVVDARAPIALRPLAPWVIPVAPWLALAALGAAVAVGRRRARTPPAR